MASLVAVVAIAAGCGKSEPSRAASALPVEELALFKQLPPGTIAMAGSYAAIQRAQTMFGGLADAIPDQTSVWMKCGIASWKRAKGAAVVTKTEVRIVATGLTEQDVLKCAFAGGFRSSEDEDKKYLVVEFPMRGGPFAQAYLMLPSGAVYIRQPFVARPARAPTRAELEADVAAIAKGPTAADDPALLKPVAKVDRSTAMWFSGTATDTSFADKLREISGTIDVARGTTADLTLQLADEDLGPRVDEMWAQTKQRKPAELANTIDRMVFERSGDRVHVVVTVDDKQLDDLARLMASRARSL
jgi:hypothetical protein